MCTSFVFSFRGPNISGADRSLIWKSYGRRSVCLVCQSVCLSVSEWICWGFALHLQDRWQLCWFSHVCCSFVCVGSDLSVGLISRPAAGPGPRRLYLAAPRQLAPGVPTEQVMLCLSNTVQLLAAKTPRQQDPRPRSFQKRGPASTHLSRTTECLPEI